MYSKGQGERKNSKEKIKGREGGIETEIERKGKRFREK